MQVIHEADEERQLRETIEAQRRSETPDIAVLAPAVIELSTRLERAGRLGESDQLLGELTPLLRRHAAPTSLEVSAVLLFRSRALMNMARFSEAEPLLQELIEIFRARGEADSELSGVVHESLAQVHAAGGRFALAETAARRAIALLGRPRGGPPPLASLYLAMSLANQGKRVEALGVIEEAIGVLARAQPEQARELAVLSRQKGLVLDSMGRVEEACAAHLRALEFLRRAGGRGEGALAEYLAPSVVLLQLLDRQSEALPLLRELLVELNREGVDESARGECVVRLGMACAETGAFDEAERHLSEGKRFLEKQTPVPAMWASASVFLSELYARSDRWSAAEAELREVLRWAENAFPAEHPEVLSVKQRLAAARHGVGHADEAHQMVAEIVERTRAFKGPMAEPYLPVLRSLAGECIQGERERSALLVLRRLKEIEGELLPPEDPQRQATGEAIARVQASVEPTMPDGVTRAELDEVPPELALYGGCMNAFLRGDHDLVVRLAGRFDFANVRTAFLVALSLRRLGRLDHANKLCDYLASGERRPGVVLPAGCISGTLSVEDARRLAPGPVELAMVCFYSGARLLGDGKPEEARELLRAAAAVEVGQVVERALAEHLLAQIDKPTTGPGPGDVVARVRKLHDEMGRARAEGRSDEALRLAKEARDVSAALGLDHPSHADCLLALAQRYDEQGEVARADELIEKGLGVMRRAFRPGHPDRETASRGVIEGSTALAPVHAVPRVLAAMKTWDGQLGPLLLIQALRRARTSESYAQLLDRSLQAVASSPILTATIDAGLGRLSPDRALTACATEEQRCLVHLVAGAHARSVGDRDGARRHYAAAASSDADCIARALAAGERSSRSEPEASTASGSLSGGAGDGPGLLREAVRLAHEGRTAESVARAEELERRLAEPECGGLDLIAMLRGLGHVYLMAGDADRAQLAWERGLDAWEKAGRNPDPSSVQIRIELGMLYLRRGQLALAERHLARARDDVLSTPLRNSVDHWNALMALTHTYLRANKGEEGVRAAREAVEVTTLLYGRDHLASTQALEGLVGALDLTRAHRETAEVAEELVEARTRLLGEAHPDSRDAMILAAAAWLRAGEKERAKPVVDRCKAALAVANRALDQRGARTLVAVAHLCRSTGDAPSAVQFAREAMSHFEACDDDKKRGGFRAAATCVADALQEQGLLAEARATRERVVEVAAASCGEASPELGMALSALGLTLDAAGDEAGARSLYERAIPLVHGSGSEPAADGTHESG